jgi:hypothetical protein
MLSPYLALRQALDDTDAASPLLCRICENFQEERTGMWITGRGSSIVLPARR